MASGNVSFSIARAAIPAVILALGASPALARGPYLRGTPTKTQYRHAPRSQPALPGYVMVLSANSTQVRVLGLPVDEFSVPFAAPSSGVTLGLPSAALFATKQLCSRRRTRCAEQGFPPTQQWFPVSAGFLRSGDLALAILNVSVQEAVADNRIGRPVPAALLVDGSGQRTSASISWSAFPAPDASPDPPAAPAPRAWPNVFWRWSALNAGLARGTRDVRRSRS
jgi:hypothetical protein